MRKKKSGTKMFMTALDRGLAIAARKEGMSIENICRALHRDYPTIQRLLKRNKVTRGIKVKPPKPAKMINRVTSFRSFRRSDGRFCPAPRNQELSQ